MERGHSLKPKFRLPRATPLRYPLAMSSPLSRRQFLRLGAGALLAAGLWPGCARFSNNGRGGAFRFAVLNDCHFYTPRCPAWFERVRASLRSHSPRPEFCLVVGDLVEHGTREEFGPMREILQSFGIPFHAVIGNHDYASDTDRSAWDEVFPRTLNYAFEHRGWQFIGLDSTQGRQYQGTKVQPATLSWLDAQLPKLQPSSPTILFSHFPFGSQVTYRPTNADAVLERFRAFNLLAVFDGHFHGFTEKQLGHTVLLTNRCCSISTGNHDGTTEKGYFLCDAKDGQTTRQFVQVETTG